MRGTAKMDQQALKIKPANTIEETGRIFGSTGATKIYELIGEGKLDSFLLGRKRLVTGDSIRRLMGELLEKSKSENPAC